MANTWRGIGTGEPSLDSSIGVLAPTFEPVPELAECVPLFVERLDIGAETAVRRDRHIDAVVAAHDRCPSIDVCQLHVRPPSVILPGGRNPQDFVLASVRPDSVIYNHMVVDTRDEKQADRLFHALADPTRRDIVMRSMFGEYSVSAIARWYPMSFAAVQKHVAILERAQLVTKQRRGREQIVHVNIDTIRVANQLLEQLEEMWRSRMDRFGRCARRRHPPRSNTMTVTNVRQDPETTDRSIITAEFDAPGRPRCGRCGQNPRRLEQWWGPPTYPATFVDHELVPGATSNYFMTGPEGDRHHGWWRVVVRRRAEAAWRSKRDSPTTSGIPTPRCRARTMRVEIREQDGATTRMTITTTYPSLEAMERLMAMGMEEGLIAAIGQIDDLVSAEVTSR